MQTHSFKRRLIITTLVTPLLFLSGWANAAKVDKIISGEVARTNDSAKSQNKINKTHDKTGDLLSDYKSVLKIVEGLEVYNGLLQKQLDDQNSELSQLEQSLKDVALIERQIIPLMVRMIDSLDQFVKLDIPFLQQERATRVSRLQKMMERADVTAAEKFRRVMEAYQIENDYGRTIEAYKGTAKVAGKEREVDFLRIGRTALIYQSISREHTGMWNKQDKAWQELPAQTYRNQVSKGLKIAKKQIAPDLLMLPIQAAEAAK
ncbi:MAG: DUF3450 domain-containing protein [Gammaproteobacteria bacterium]|nr:DUF3450 domain-containing protein [Gammaproteobacteria bacterium]